MSGGVGGVMQLLEEGADGGLSLNLVYFTDDGCTAPLLSVVAYGSWRNLGPQGRIAAEAHGVAFTFSQAEVEPLSPLGVGIMRSSCPCAGARRP